MRSPVLILFLFAGLCTAKPQPTPQDEQLLSRIKANVANNLSRLPNYTCRETIERTVKPARSKRYMPVDTLRLDVAYVSGRELFAWPGAPKFEEKRIEDVVGRGGALGNGQFGLHARAIFLKNSASFKRVGEVTREGRKLIQFDYQIPREKSEFAIRTSGAANIVGYHGSFWVDPGSLDLVRLEVRADNLPRDLELSSDVNIMEYGRVRIGQADFLLPKWSEMTLADPEGEENRNRIRFTDCRQYMGESSISFIDPSSATDEPEQIKQIVLPPDTYVEMSLKTPVVAGKSAIGDIVTAEVVRDIRKGSTVLIPKGATATGRITHLDRRTADFGEYQVIAITFTEVKNASMRADLFADLEEVGFRTASQYHVPYAPDPPPGLLTSLRATLPEKKSGEGVFFARGPKLISGVRMLWRTAQPK